MENGGFNVKEYFISEIDIDKLYHLSDIKIQLDSTKRQHLLLTGKNGSGKTSLLLEIEKFLKAINDEKFSKLRGFYKDALNRAKVNIESAASENDKYEAEKRYRIYADEIAKYSDGVRITLNECDGIEKAYQDGKFIMAYFPSERKAQFDVPNGVENIELSKAYRIDNSAGAVLLKYMVHLKTQQSYAQNAGDESVAQMIQKWFDRFESALRILLDEQSVPSRIRL